MTAITAAVVHPVSGPAIENGILLLRGDRIITVGKQGEVTIPEGATVRDFPTGHVYPGLIDAETDAFTDPALQQANLDPGLGIADDLLLRGTRDDELAAAGITTAYIAAPSGQGAIVRTTKDGFEVWEGKEKAALQLRMTRGPVPTHALQRQQQLDGQLKTFDGLEEYTKAKEDYTKALDKYAKDFEAYLEYHEKNKDKKPAEKPEATPPAAEPGEQPAREGRRTGGRRGGPPGGGISESGSRESSEGEQLELALEQLVIALLESESAQDPTPAPKQDPAEAGKPGDQGPSDGKPEEKKDAAKKDEAPKRPTYPKAVPEDPAKEALLAVLDGALPLRVEAHRPDELRAALQLQQDKNIPVLVLEQAYGAAAITQQLTNTGTAVVLTEVLPNSMPKLYEAFDPSELPRLLQAAGVPFAIASGTARRASLLPMMAATAVGKGLDRDAALRAITLTPAEILGIQKDTGSLQRGKFADLVVFDRPLFQSDSRVLLVLGRGQTEYEVQ